jgi:tRNA pseudouridine55 synthase
MLNGWLILDKPTGMTSAHAVNKVKRLLLTSPERGEVAALAAGGGDSRSISLGATPSRPTATLPPLGGGNKLKIGHAGTLDPLASGILPLALGEATKTINYMMDAAKSYAFTVSWGEKRDTDDREGKVIASSDKRPTLEEINAILPRFIGEIEQMPPQFSALKVDGERAYDLAREGKVAELKARRVRVDSLEIASPLGGEAARLGHALRMSLVEREGVISDSTSCSPSRISKDLLSSKSKKSGLPPLGGGEVSTTFLCHCGKGTYIRSIARDMGDILGCYGHVSSLRRLSVGKFSEKDAISLENLEKMVHTGRPKLLPVESALDDILALDIPPPQATLLQRGQAIQVPHSPNTTVLARCDGKPVAICEVSQGTMKPVRVFNL